MAVTLLTACSVLGSKEGGISDQAEEKISHTMIRELSETANIAYKNKDWDNAERNYGMLLARDPENELALYRLGNISFRTKRIDEATQYYEKLLRINPNHSKSHHNLAVCRLVQAKKHLKLYSVMMDPALDKNSIDKILKEIDDFARSQSSKQSKKTL